MQSSLLRSNIRLLELEWLLAIGSNVQSSFLRSNIRQLELKLAAKLHFEAVTELTICNFCLDDIFVTTCTINGY